jgi:hypothetical protein
MSKQYYFELSNPNHIKPEILSKKSNCKFDKMIFHKMDESVVKYRKGLITEGFFSRCRNPNYLGEILIYLGFALLAQHWLPFLVLGGFITGVFIPNMLKKDRSLSRYPHQQLLRRSGTRTRSAGRHL